MTLAWGVPDPAHLVSPTLRLIAHGDSMALGGGCRKRFAYQAAALIAAETADVADLKVLGINGVSYTYAWLDAGYAYTLTQDLTQRLQAFLATGLPVWVFVQSGTNGISLGGNTGVQEYTAFQTYFSALIALGVTASRVVIGTMPPRGAGFETERGNLNTAIVSGAAGLGHKLARIDSNVDIGQAGQNTDTTYYQADTVHWNDAGAAKAARIFKDAMYA
jgi:lysophospholipase L1-like esterase